MEAFKKLTANSAFNELFYSGPYVTREFGNVSSRPSKRPVLNQKGDGKKKAITSDAIKGENPKITDRRSISVERLSAHSGTQLMSLLSVKEGLEYLNDKEVLHGVYKANKSARDSWRGTAMVLGMTDFDTAWEMMICKERPGDTEIKELAEKFKLPSGERENGPAVTLAWIEQYAVDTAKLLHKAVLGEVLEIDGMSNCNILSSTLNEAWPKVAKQMEYRERQGEFSHHMEANLVADMNLNIDRPLEEVDMKILQAVYAGADMTNSPVGAVMTLRREVSLIILVHQAPLGLVVLGLLLMLVVSNELKLPSALAEAGSKIREGR